MVVQYVDLNEDQPLLCEDHDAEGLLDHGDHEDRRMGHEDHEDRRMDHEDHDEVVGLLLHEGRGGQLGHHTFVLILRELLLEMLLVAGLSLLEDHG